MANSIPGSKPNAHSPIRYLLILLLYKGPIRKYTTQKLGNILPNSVKFLLYKENPDFLILLFLLAINLLKTVQNMERKLQFVQYA